MKFGAKNVLSAVSEPSPSPPRRPGRNINLESTAARHRYKFSLSLRMTSISTATTKYSLSCYDGCSPGDGNAAIGRKLFLRSADGGAQLSSQWGKDRV